MSLSPTIKHILFIHHGHGIGGAPISMRALLDEVIKLPGIKITILFLFKSDAETLFSDLNCDKIVLNKPYYYFNHTSRHPKWYRFELIFLMVISWIYTSFIRAPRLLKKINPDLVYLNSCVLTDWSYASRKLRIKNILHVREAVAYGATGLRRKILNGFLNRFPDSILFISKENMRRLTIDDENKTVLAYNDVGLAFEKYEWENSPRRIKKESLILRVGFLGGMSEIKGLKTLVGAFEYLNDNIEILLGGHITEAKYNRSFGDIPRKVKIVGLITDVIGFMEKIDILTSPITTTHFCRPVIEMAAMGKPSILPNLEGMDEMIEPEKTGFIFNEGDSKDLARKINDAASDRNRLKQMGVKAREKYERDFSREKNTKKIIAVFKKLLN